MAHIKQKCDFCNLPAAYVGKTKMGPAAFMCSAHFAAYGTTECRGIVPVIPKKRCSVCGAEKPLDQFYCYRDHSGTKRYRTECKACNLASRKQQRFMKG